MEKQTYLFETESKRYVSAYLNQKEKYSYIFPKSINQSDVDNICDVGCGNGDLIKAYLDHFKLSNCIGVEPNEISVKLLNEKFETKKNINFINAFAHSLPFQTNNFDIVITNSVLHWIGRDEYLQSIGELIRVTKKYLIIMDFVSKHDYKVPYAHLDGLFTYKQDFAKIVINSGIMEKLEENRFYFCEKSKKNINISESDLTPFLGNEINYHSRKMVVFKKNQ